MSGYRSAFRLLVVTMLLAACGDGSTSPPEPDIRVLGSSVQAGGIMSVRTTSVTLPQAQYGGTLGGAEIRFARMDDSTLVGIVPDMAAGAQELTATLGGRTFSQTVTVAAARTFADPAGHVDARLDDVVASYPETAPAGVMQAEWTAQRDSMLAAVAAARTALAGMSADEQLATARFITALEEALGPLLADAGAANLVLAAADGCGAAAGKALLHSTLYLGGFAALVGGVMVPGYQPLIVAGAVLIWKAKPKAEKAVTAMMAICSRQTTVSLSPLESPFSGAFELTASKGFGDDGEQGLRGIAADTATAMAAGRGATSLIFVRKRPLRTAPSQGLQAFSASHIPDNSQFSAINSALERIVSIVEPLPAFVKRHLPLPFRISTVGEKPVQTTTLGPDSVRITNVTRGISLSSSTDGAVLVLTADAPGTDERPFTFNLVSTTEPTARDTISAILVKEGVTLIPRAERYTATVTTNESQNTWTMRCRMEWSVVITGVDPVHLSSMTWNNRAVGSGFPSYPGSEQYPPNSYAPGTYTLWGEWWRTWVSGENSSDFVVTLNMGYRNNVTSAAGTTNEIEMACAL